MPCFFVYITIVHNLNNLRIYSRLPHLHTEYPHESLLKILLHLLKIQRK